MPFDGFRAATGDGGYGSLLSQGRPKEFECRGNPSSSYFRILPPRCKFLANPVPSSSRRNGFAVAPVVRALASLEG
jgi:hypothetical protein